MSAGWAWRFRKKPMSHWLAVKKKRLAPNWKHPKKQLERKRGTKKAVLWWKKMPRVQFKRREKMPRCLLIQKTVSLFNTGFPRLVCLVKMSLNLLVHFQLWGHLRFSRWGWVAWHLVTSQITWGCLSKEMQGWLGRSPDWPTCTRVTWWPNQL